MKRAKHHSRPVYAESVPLRHSVHINSRFYLLEYCHDILKSPLSSELMFVILVIMEHTLTPFNSA